MDYRMKLDSNFKNSFIGEIIKVCNTEKNNTNYHSIIYLIVAACSAFLSAICIFFTEKTYFSQCTEYNE